MSTRHSSRPDIPDRRATCPNISICPLPSRCTPPALLCHVHTSFEPSRHPRPPCHLSQYIYLPPPLSLHASHSLPLVTRSAPTYPTDIPFHAACPDISNCPFSVPFPCPVHSSREPRRHTRPTVHPVPSTTSSPDSSRLIRLSPHPVYLSLTQLVPQDGAAGGCIIVRG